MRQCVQALNEWMRKRDSELEDVRRSADRAQEQAVDLALAAAEAEMNHQLSGERWNGNVTTSCSGSVSCFSLFADLSSQLANERATTDDLRQSVKLLISQHDETVRLMTERHQQELEDTKAAHAREVEHAIQTTQADCREEYQRMKEQVRVVVCLVCVMRVVGHLPATLRPWTDLAH